MTESPNLGPLRAERKRGDESFVIEGRNLDVALADYWQWSASDLVSNTDRGVLAEFLVAQDLGVADGVRAGWEPYDLKTISGIKVEVKSSAYCQAWYQTRYSAITFGIAPRRAWDFETNRLGEETRRWSDVYVFCLLHHKDKTTLDPMNLDQWTFYVLSTAVLNERYPLGKTLSLKQLRALTPAEVAFGQIGAAIEKVVADR